MLNELVVRIGGEGDLCDTNRSINGRTAGQERAAGDRSVRCDFCRSWRLSHNLHHEGFMKTEFSRLDMSHCLEFGHAVRTTSAAS